MSRGSRWWRWRTSWYCPVAAHARRRSWSSYVDCPDQGKPTSENSSKYVNFGRKVFTVCGVILKAIWLFEIKNYIIFILKYTLIFVSILLPVVVKFDMKKCHNSSFIILGFCSFYLLSWFTSFTFVMCVDRIRRYSMGEGPRGCYVWTITSWQRSRRRRKIPRPAKKSRKR